MIFQNESEFNIRIQVKTALLLENKKAHERQKRLNHFGPWRKMVIHDVIDFLQFFSCIFLSVFTDYVQYWIYKQFPLCTSLKNWFLIYFCSLC